MNLFIKILVGASLIITFFWAPETHASNYTFTFLKVPGAKDTVAFDINNSGQVVGYCGVAAKNIARGFTYAAGKFKTFNCPGASGRTWATGLNDAGHIVGQYKINIYNGFLKVGNQYITIAVPEANNSTDAKGINEAGQIVGFYAAPGPTRISNSFIFSGGRYSTFAIFGATRTDAFGINDSGKIVGRFFDSNYHGFLYDGSTFTYLNFPGATDTVALKINNHGDIVGAYKTNGVYHGFILKDGKYFTLDFPGAVRTAATGINDRGQVVGLFADSSGHYQGFIGTPNFSADDFVFPVLGINQSDPYKNKKDPLLDGWTGPGVGKKSATQGHLGQDYYLKKGDSSGKPVYAIAKGEIVEVLNGPGQYGWCDNKDHGWGPVVVIKHSNSKGFNVSANAIIDPENCGTELNPKVIYSLYGHLSKESIKILEIGQQVKMGDKIGEIGKFGIDQERWKKNHLHFEIKDEQGFLEGLWYKSHNGICPGSIPYIVCGSREIKGVGVGYSYDKNFAPHRYIPGVFILDNIAP